MFYIFTGKHYQVFGVLKFYPAKIRGTIKTVLKKCANLVDIKSRSNHSI